MNTYRTAGRLPVQAETSHDAAKLLATRAARYHYGRSATCRSLKQLGCTPDGSVVEYSAFIGRTSSTNPHEMTGRTIQFSVFSR